MLDMPIEGSADAIIGSVWRTACGLDGKFMLEIGAFERGGGIDVKRDCDFIGWRLFAEADPN